MKAFIGRSLQTHQGVRLHRQADTGFSVAGHSFARPHMSCGISTIPDEIDCG
jgi:hypothetical protein